MFSEKQPGEANKKAEALTQHRSARSCLVKASELGKEVDEEKKVHVARICWTSS